MTILWLLLAALAGGAIPAAAQGTADLVLLNGRVYTLDARRPWADAVAVRGDTIVAVGSTAEVRQLVGSQTRVIDLGGAFVTPGFNDAHVHVDATGRLLVGANLLDVHEPDPFVQRIKEAARRLPKGSWILGGDWGAYEQWQAGSAGGQAPAKGRPPFMPDRALIDPVTPDHPVLVNRFDRSVFLANSLALKLAGVTESTPNPPGARSGGPRAAD